MKLEIIRIENRTVTCAVEGVGLINIARRWFTDDIQVGDVINIDVSKKDEYLD